MLAQFFNTSSNATDGNNVVPTGIALLSLCWTPLTILRRISLIIVESFKALAIWSVAHISKEVFKSKPAFTNSDTPSPVRGPTSILRVFASSAHRSPYPVNFSIALTVGGVDFKVITPTGTGVPTVQTATGSSMISTTVAYTSPNDVAESIYPYSGYHCELAKAFSFERLSSRHNDDSSIVVFSSGFRLQPDPLRHYDIMESEIQS